MPERLHIPVTSVLDEHSTLKGAVLLGWTHTGNHLVSYTSSPVPAADGEDGHHLQVLAIALSPSHCMIVGNPRVQSDTLHGFHVHDRDLLYLPDFVLNRDVCRPCRMLCMQLWSFQPFQQAVRLCNIPLFRNESGEAIHWLKDRNESSNPGWCPGEII